MNGVAIRVRGVVQGVGFRPTVWRLARQHALAGQVWNDAEGVMIHAWGPAGNIERFIATLKSAPPPLARITAIEQATLADSCSRDDFIIAGSHAGQANTEVAADAAICPDCQADILDPANRRFGYALTNCTHCGPRLSIIRAIPYDRANTSMSIFPMCPDCLAEYESPADRRFHAQPNACPVCGPKLSFTDGTDGPVDGDAVGAAAARLRAGEIVAVKGIGGFHLACDALNESAVAKLRERKQRFHKPFALMARDIEQLSRFAHLSEEEERLLGSSQAPVVLLAAREENGIAAAVAPDQMSLGFMLPYTPLHHLLMRQLEGPIVLTSGNISDEPQCTGDAEARERLGGIADGYLGHDREIVNRLDDSVARLMAGRPRLIRRARGYAPASLRLPAGLEAAGNILAMGGELKNSFCLSRANGVVVSQHMGDLEHAKARLDYRKNLDLYQHLYDFRAECVAIDLHPDYASTQFGRQLAADGRLELIGVQHHHAHIAACMAEHGLPVGTQVLGIALDGLGYGADGRLWGGEFMLAGYADFKRLGTIAAIPMPGGARSIHEPWRSAYAHLHAAGWPEIREKFAATGIVRLLQEKPLSTLERMLEREINSPPASSTGRLFDAVAAALGLSAESVSHEGQAAMQLEALAEPAFVAEQGNGYPVAIDQADGIATLSWRPLWLALLDDLSTGVAKKTIAARFHHGLIAAVADLATELATQHGLRQVALGGGCFQNRLLLEGVIAAMEKGSLQVLAPELLPANDGGLCFGQAAVAAARRLGEK